VVGLISLVILAPAIAALYAFRLVGLWRWIYVGGAVASLYLNVFVLVVQAFGKVPFLQPLAETQFASATQIVVLVIFVALGIGALRKFSPAITALA
jgi:hypothetical protein